MDSEIGLDVIKCTQQTLGKFVERPALSEKLLRKPPFRFLHDIVTYVIKNNGLLQGLYTEEELVSENVNNRDGKIAFLTKLIAVVSLVIEKPLSARPSKIIAGQEPEKTNELLQCIGIALENKLSSDSAVKIYKDKSKNKKEKDVSKSKENRKIQPDYERRREENKEETIIASKPPKKNQGNNSISRISDKSRAEKVSSRDKLQTERSVPRIENNKDKEKKKRVSSKDPLTSRSKPPDKEPKLPPNASARSSKSSSSIKSLNIREIKSKKDSTQEKEHRADVDHKEIEHNSLQSKVGVAADADESKLPLHAHIEKEDIRDNSVENSSELHKPPDSIDHRPIQNDFIHNASSNISEPMEEPTEKSKSNHSALSVPNVETEAEEKLIQMQTKNEVEKEIFKIEELNMSKQTSFEIKVESKATTHESVDLPDPKKSSWQGTTQKSVDLPDPKKSGLQGTTQKSVDLPDLKRSSLQGTTQKSVNLPDPKKSSLQGTAMVENLVKVVQNFQENKDVNKSQTSIRPPSARPPSARPGAPRLKDRSDLSLNPSEPIVSGKVNVIVEKYGADNEDDDGSIVMVESNIETLDPEKPAEGVSPVIGAGHGHLVQQILDTHSDYKRNQGGGVEIEWEFGARKAKEAYAQEIEHLRTGLQAVSRAANPLGKLFDHIQEDVEVMRQELDHWKEVYKQASVELSQQRSLTEQSTLPLQFKLRQLDAEILDKRDQINNLKAQMYKNTAEIDKLLACNNVQ